ncbi:U-box domain-containing protein 43-like [Diospyros lotus]|uniref:U-box domain-containing protein 43-like n=1 Tax=Diospyros lotus TaxID=55363 RepID=UPI002251BDA1|nr:U-box domain-containing protein 43-like [Diospyros lotus]XP_052208279.1 U-box domain-containing protein 43-like [Diospyros lotus]XP_052208280.1 U-box domain-containing protein 43-like [Diospyros lotus]XP_052208281.1 U-box domain-containing protein 43-like [Diospyros lotus]
MMEFIPMGAILTVLTSQVMKTAQAAKDVIFEKESFKVLSEHLFDIERVLTELQLQNINDSQATRQALEFLEADVKRANNLVEKYKNRAPFYLLVKCRHIVKEVQDVTREIGRSLAALSLANVEVLSGISEQVNRLQNEMQSAEFEASQNRVQIVDKLNQGLTDQKLDHGFANDILKEIAKAVGVPVEPSEISKELASFRREKEEAADRKEKAEVFFLEQVIELLSQADAARDYEEIKKQYFQRLQFIERLDPREEYIQPYKAFICCITGNVMNDPVSLCTGTACERTALEARFERGEKTDPETGALLEDFSYRSNIQVRQSIQEWKELNYCLKIRSCNAKLLSGQDPSVEEALNQMQELMIENSINKDWISIGGLTDMVVLILGRTNNRGVKEKLLITLKDIVEGNPRNKDKVVESQGFDHVIPCLGADSSLSKAAVELLYELLQNRPGWDASVCRKFLQQRSTIHALVTLLKTPVTETAEKAEEILMKLCDEDENIVHAAEAEWYKPLIDRIIQGSKSSRISMVRALVSMELGEQHIQLLGEAGIIPPLLEMASGNFESKELSLSALLKLSGCHENKRLIADAGGVPMLLELMFSFHLSTIIIAKSSEVLEKLTSNGDGTKFFVDGTAKQLELEPIITNLLAFQQNPHWSYTVRRPALLTLLGICQSEAGLVKTAVLTSNGGSLILPLLDDSDLVIRETALSLLFLFSQHEPEGVVEYLLRPRRLEALVGFLENSKNSDVQMAAAGLLANLPKSVESLTKKLIEMDGLRAIVDILRTGTMGAKENALSALFRFADPTNLESQRKVVELGAYPLLVDFLESGSVTSKARAAALIGNLSMSTLKLTIRTTKEVGCWFFRRARDRLCSAHGGTCSVATTFCMLEAKALPKLVNLLQEKVHATTYEVIQALSTLVREEPPHRGANVLHQAKAIQPILEVLTWGTVSLKEEALRLLAKVFRSREMVDCYGAEARLALVYLAENYINEGGHLQINVAIVLSLIERYSRSSRSLVVGQSR